MWLVVKFLIEREVLLMRFVCKYFHLPRIIYSHNPPAQLPSSYLSILRQLELFYGKFNVLELHV